MTSNTVLVTGIRLSLEELDERAEDWLDARLRQVVGVLPEVNSPTFVLIHNELPHNDIEAHSLFLAWKTFEYQEEFLTERKIQEMFEPIRLRDSSLVNIPPQYIAVLGKFDQSKLQYGVWSVPSGTETEMKLWQ